MFLCSGYFKHWDQNVLKLFFITKKQLADVVLVRRNCFTIALAKCRKQIQILLVFQVIAAVLDDVSDSLSVNLFVKKLLVVCQQFRYCKLSIHVVIFISHHALLEEMRNPLRNIKLVVLVVFGTQFQYSID